MRKDSGMTEINRILSDFVKKLPPPVVEKKPVYPFVKTPLSVLPKCIQRLTQCRNRKLTIKCGHRDLIEDVDKFDDLGFLGLECLTCKGFVNPMIVGKLENFSLMNKTFFLKK